MARQFDGRVAVVTGGGSGIGRETARLLASAGARVVVADMNEEGARGTVGEASESHMTAVQVNVRDRASVDVLMAKAIGWAGRLDILINCAGIVRNAPAESVSEETWALVLDVNLTGTWRCCQAAFPFLVRQGGAIVNVSSIGGVVCRPGGGAYGPSKAGVGSLTAQLAAEWGHYGIRVNAIAPGFIETPMTEAGLRDQAWREVRRKSVPLGRIGIAADPAQVAVFLVSDAAGYVSGQTLTVDGGFLQTLLLDAGGAASTGAKS